jgi:hypothetical protein
MWHTKSLTDVLFPDIYLISDAVALSCSWAVTILQPRYARITVPLL